MKSLSKLFHFAVLLIGSTAIVFAQAPESIEVLEFGENQTLFLADSYGGHIYAYPMSEPAQTEGVSYNIRNLDSKIADALGTRTDRIKIMDMVVNPVSKNAFIAVHKVSKNKYSPMLVKVTPKGQISNFDLKKQPHTQFKVDDAPATDIKFWDRVSLRAMTFTDLEFHKGKLYVAGTSNADFDASLRIIDYPFSGTDFSTTTVEIFHTVHNQQETRSPIQTMDIVNINGEDHLLAVYTCTPLVTIPLSSLRDGAHINGKVIAELGYGNSPIDIKTFEAQDPQGNQQKVALVIHTSRGATLFNMTDIASSNLQAGMTEGVGFQSAGTPFFQPAMGGPYQLEDLDQGHLLTLRRNAQTGQSELLTFMKGFYFRLTDHISDYIYPDYVYGEEGELWRPVQNMLKIDEGHPETVVEKGNR